MKKHKIGIQIIWITPLRALAVEIQKAIPGKKIKSVEVLVKLED